MLTQATVYEKGAGRKLEHEKVGAHGAMAKTRPGDGAIKRKPLDLAAWLPAVNSSNVSQSVEVLVSYPQRPASRHLMLNFKSSVP